MPELLSFDLETTGVNPHVDCPVSYGIVRQGLTDEGGAVDCESGYINPGVPIPAAASAIHGITNEMVLSAPSVAKEVPRLIEVLRSTWRAGGVVVGMNVSYDLTMLDALNVRLGHGKLDSEELGPVIDVLVLDRHVDRFRRGRRTLGALCAVYGVDVVNAHRALDDARASLEILRALYVRYPQLRELSHSECNDTVGGWYRDWLSSFSQHRIRTGEPPIADGQFEWPIHARE